MFTFSRSFQYWTLSNHVHLSIVNIESKGRDLDELLTNAEMSLETWHGNEGPDWSIGDLSSQDYATVCQLFTEFLNESTQVSNESCR